MMRATATIMQEMVWGKVPYVRVVIFSLLYVNAAMETLAILQQRLLPS